MIKLYSSACIDAPVAEVWAKLAALEDIQLWSESVIRAKCDGDLTQGVGAERVCDVSGNLTIRERWIQWDEGHSYTYEGFGLPMMKRAVNPWTVIPKGEKTLLTSEAELHVKGGILAKFIEPLMSLYINRMASNALAPFKYFVENGNPFSGKASELPLAPVTC